MPETLGDVGKHAPTQHVTNAKVGTVTVSGFIVPYGRKDSITIVSMGLHYVKFSIRPAELRILASAPARVLVGVWGDVRIRRVVVAIQSEGLKIGSPLGSRRLS